MPLAGSVIEQLNQDDKIPELPSEEHRQAWERICKKWPKDGPKRQALYLVLCGFTYRAAATFVGMDGRWGHIHDQILRAGYRDLVNRTPRYHANWREAANLYTEALIARATDKDGKGLDDVAVRDLAVVGGIATDKVRDFEKGRGENPADSPLMQLARAAAEGKISMEIKVEPVDRPGREEPVGEG